MALFAIADLHLSQSAEKPMDVFGGVWNGYTEKIRKNLSETIKADDVIVIAGDISWAINLAEAVSDFEFLENLPGKKIILKGNHDLWWDTLTKIKNILLQHGITSIDFLYNNFFLYKNIAICGTRGWYFQEAFEDKHDEKIFRRELLRLKASLDAARKANAERTYCFLHYPPLYTGWKCEEIIEILKEYGVSRCYYGHLHGESIKGAVEGVYDGIEYKLISADRLNFIPIMIEN